MPSRWSAPRARARPIWRRSGRLRPARVSYPPTRLTRPGFGPRSPPARWSSRMRRRHRARTAPATWPIATPDVISRLRAMPLVTLQAPDDAMLRAVIVKLAADRQLALDESVVSYLSTHIERSFAAARSAVIALDNEALRRGRPPTRALAADMFRDTT